MRKELRSGRVGFAVDDMKSRNSPLGSMPATNIHYAAAVLDTTANGKFGYAGSFAAAVLASQKPKNDPSSLRSSG